MPSNYGTMLTQILWRSYYGKPFGGVRGHFCFHRPATPSENPGNSLRRVRIVLATRSTVKTTKCEVISTQFFQALIDSP